MDTMLPILRQMHDARHDGERARILLSCPDSVFLKYAHEFAASCERGGFDAGAQFCALRQASLRAVRDEAGQLPMEIRADLEDAASRMVGLAAFTATDFPLATDL